MLLRLTQPRYTRPTSTAMSRIVIRMGSVMASSTRLWPRAPLRSRAEPGAEDRDGDAPRVTWFPVLSCGAARIAGSPAGVHVVNRARVVATVHRKSVARTLIVRVVRPLMRLGAVKGGTSRVHLRAHPPRARVSLRATH